MNNLIKRSITGLIFITILISSIYLSRYSFSALFLIISILGVLEFYRLCKKTNASPQTISGVIISVIIFVIAFFHASGNIKSTSWLVVIPLSVFIFINELYRKKTNPFTNIAYTFLGLIYVTLPFALLNYLVIDNTPTGVIFSPHLLLGIFYLMWVSDSGAYLTGSAFGKHKLFERISPKKTWEGTIGGSIAALLAAWIISMFYKELTLSGWLIVALINVVIGAYGDLTESLFKRSIAIKDSGKILPGHGGILDRFDSIILASPIVYVYLEIFVR